MSNLFIAFGFISFIMFLYTVYSQAQQIKALKKLKAMAAAYGFDISGPAKNAKEAVQWTYFAYLASSGTFLSLLQISPPRRPTM